MRHSALRSSWAAALTLVAILVLAPQAGLADPIPETINYQGSLTNSAGVPIDTTVDMTFALYSDSGGVTQEWTETHTGVVVTDGVFSVTLGSVSALDLGDFDDALWLGITVGTDPQMAPLQAIDAVGYALRAKGAESATLAGDLSCTSCVAEAELDFDPATQAELNSAVAAIDWSVLTSIPADIADGDDNTQLTEGQVETFVTNGVLDLNASTTLGTQTILTTASSLSWSSLTSVPADIADGDDDTLAGIVGCSASEVAKRNGTNTAWECTADADTPDTTLDNAAVDAFVENGPLDLDAGTTIGAKEILAGARRVLSGSATTIGFGTTGSDTVGCGVNEVATGGGYLATSTDIFAYGSYPTGTPTPTGWQVDAKNTAGAGSGDIEAYVICATATP